MLLALLRDRTTLVWLGLVLATAVSWQLGTGHGLAGKSAAVVVLAIAFIKVRFVGRYFMEIRDAPRGLQVVFDAWVVVVAAALIGIYSLA
jgi:heme/copper-type cytochrome/quinol oxidase subunit 4